MRVSAILLAPVMLGACAASAPGEVPERPGGGTCNADGAARFIGQRATAALGADVLAATGARTLRWGTVGGAMTMDYNESRVNVIYNAAMMVERITCG